MKTFSFVLLGLLVTARSFASCPPAGQDADRLRALKATQFKLADGARQSLALALVDCLVSPDPEFRDAISYEAYATWMRARALDRTTLGALLFELSARLAPDAANHDGFAKPFAALVLSEVARTDRIDPWMTEPQRTELVVTAARYLQGIDDYRGFIDGEGWRHGVAHGADLALQLILNPAVTPDDVDALLGAVADQVAPERHAYIFNEPERLARPVLYAALRGHHAPEDWARWFSELVDPAPLADWAEAYRSERGLMRKHNLQAFLQSVYVNARDSGKVELEALSDAALKALRSLP